MRSAAWRWILVAATLTQREVDLAESPYPMISVEEAVETVLRHVAPLTPVKVPFDDALGLVLAQDVAAVEPMPPFAASAVDGYAVIAADTSSIRQVIGEQMAGDVTDLRVVPGTAVRVTTGAPLPPGADAMVMVESVAEDTDGCIRLLNSVQAGANVRPVGQDLAAGQLVLPHGCRLGAAEIGLLATVGQIEVLVHPRPRVAVMSSGDELVEPGDPLHPGQIRDSNRFTLLSAVREAGGQPIDIGRMIDQPQAVSLALERAVHEADAVLTSGGVSMGQRDLIKPYLASRGHLHFGRVRAKPGKPVTFATVDGVPVFAMPGFPVSALVSFEIYVRPALLKMAGHSHLLRPRQRVFLEHSIRHDADRTEFQRAVVKRLADGRCVARTTGHQGSGRLLSMVGANALLVVPAEQGSFDAGTELEAWLVGPVLEDGQA
jgi:molybdenum cofactor synthesis domain-containing protein